MVSRQNAIKYVNGSLQLNENLQKFNILKPQLNLMLEFNVVFYWNGQNFHDDEFFDDKPHLKR